MGMRNLIAHDRSGRPVTPAAFLHLFATYFPDQRATAAALPAHAQQQEPSTFVE
jgi:hypothetical protein